MAIKKLLDVGMCKVKKKKKKQKKIFKIQFFFFFLIKQYLISQNVDGLHLRSGVDPKKISELHGNTNLEICVKCGSRYLRDFRTREASHAKDHRTSRICTKPNCKGALHDSIIVIHFFFFF